jgi:hypothetical protein
MGKTALVQFGVALCEDGLWRVQSRVTMAEGVDERSYDVGFVTKEEAEEKMSELARRSTRVLKVGEVQITIGTSHCLPLTLEESSPPTFAEPCRPRHRRLNAVRDKEGAAPTNKKHKK